MCNVSKVFEKIWPNFFIWLGPGYEYVKVVERKHWLNQLGAFKGEGGGYEMVT